jgi:transcriptional regulator with XRE-family HTH domain
MIISDTYITTLVTNSQQKNHLSGYSHERHSGDTAGMKNRILELRTKKNISLAKLEGLTGISAQQLNRLEKGERSVNDRNMVSIAKALGCKPEELISDKSQSMLPVLGKLHSGIITMNAQADPLDEKQWIKTPSWVEYSEDLYIIEIEDDSMAPKVYKGDSVIVKKNDSAICADLNSRAPYIVKIKDGDTLLRLVRKGYTYGKYNLHGHNADIIEDVILERCDRVIGTLLE